MVSDIGSLAPRLDNMLLDLGLDAKDYEKHKESLAIYIHFGALTFPL
jgi:hypothetical protein